MSARERPQTDEQAVWLCALRDLALAVLLALAVVGAWWAGVELALAWRGASWAGPG